MNYQLVSEAIVKHVNGTFPRSQDAVIEREFGPEIAQNVRAVYDRAMDVPVDRSSPQHTMDMALDVLAEFMSTELAELTAEAKTRLNYCYIMTWK